MGVLILLIIKLKYDHKLKKIEIKYDIMAFYLGISNCCLIINNKCWIKYEYKANEICYYIFHGTFIFYSNIILI